MTINVLSTAKHLAKKSGWSLSNLDLQKILYLTHMFHLGRKNGEPLVHGLFEAWDYGPVHPDLYQRAKIFGSAPVGNVFHSDPDVPVGGEKAILDEAYESLGHAGPGKLVRATHSPRGAWHLNYVPGRRHCVIPNEDILAEYQALDNAH